MCTKRIISLHKYREHLRLPKAMELEAVFRKSRQTLFSVGTDLYF